MRSIGIKSLFWLIMTAGLLALVFMQDTLDLSELDNVDPRLTLAIGFLATILSGVVYRGFRLWQPSMTVVHMCRPGREVSGSYLFSIRNWDFHVTLDGSVEGREFSALSMRVLIFVFFVLVGSLCFTYREFDMVSRVQQMHYLGKDRYCPDPEEGAPVEKIRPECRLIYRAFELGYAKDLGKCGRAEDDQPVICELQMRDEPDLHYSYRVLKREVGELVSHLRDQNGAKFQEELATSAGKFQPLLRDYFGQINNHPQAAHILVTNLPNPKGPLTRLMQKVFTDSHCRGYQRMPNNGPVVSTPADLPPAYDHAVGHLLFESSYPTSVAKCEEFEILWGIPEDLCHELPRRPEEILAQWGIKDRVDQVLESYERKKQLRPKLKFKSPKDFVSVSCLTFDAAKGGVTNELVSFNGQQISFRWIQVAKDAAPALTSPAMFKTLAHLLAPTFTYSGFQSKATFHVEGAMDVTADTMNGEGFDLSRLGYLRDADVFLSVPWLETRADLMEVYPYYLHLAHFVESFRAHYRLKRGRIQ